MNDQELIARAETNLSNLYQKNTGFAEFIRDSINHSGPIELVAREELFPSDRTDPYLFLYVDPDGSARLTFRSFPGIALMQTSVDHSWEELGREFDKKYQIAFGEIIKKLAGSEEDIISFFQRRYGRKIKDRAIIVIQEPKIIKGTELAVVAVRREGAKRKVDPYTDPSLQRDLSILSAIVPASSTFKVGQKVRLHYFEHGRETMYSISAFPA